MCLCAFVCVFVCVCLSQCVFLLVYAYIYPQDTNVFSNDLSYIQSVKSGLWNVHETKTISDTISHMNWYLIVTCVLVCVCVCESEYEHDFIYQSEHECMYRLIW